MTQIIAISGKKQSGKDTVTNFLHGYLMMQNDVINHFFISNEGQLVIDVDSKKENGSDSVEMGILDLNQNTDSFIQYAENRIWPIIKKYSLADPLKEMLHVMFDIPFENLWGTNDQKEEKIPHLLWENMPGVYTENNAFYYSNVDPAEYGFICHEAGPMSGREIMQYFGTKIMRKMYQPIWINNCFKRIDFDLPPIAVINDCRFIDEIEAIQSRGGVVIRLLRDVYQDKDDSETACDNYDKFDLIIDNRELNIVETNNLILEKLIDKGVLSRINMSYNQVPLR